MKHKMHISVQSGQDPTTTLDISAKKEVDGFIEYAAECGHYVSFEAAISRTSVSDMQFMCKTEDYSKDTVQAWIDQWTNAENYMEQKELQTDEAALV